MPHERPRHALAQLLQKVKLWPVVGLLGARQTGKSTILREQLTKKLKAKYLLLDRKSIQVQAQKAPEYFVQSRSENLKVPLILDEVQKAPALFDAVKAEVDENRIPGRFILSGSTEFSQRTGIRESLTGRISIFHLFPFTLSETLNLEFHAPWTKMKPKLRCQSVDIHRYLKQGGMPGACFLRKEEERTEYYSSWLDTTCHRDLQQIKGANLDGALALDILYALAKAKRPTLAEIRRILRVDGRKIQKHVNALEALFVLQSIEPHRLGTGKKCYLVFDCGLAKYLGSNSESCQQIWVMNEILAQYEYSGLSRPKLSYYESTKHSYIPFIIDDRKKQNAILISDEEAPSTYTLRALHSFKAKSHDTSLFVFGPSKDFFTDENGVVHLPWTGMV